MTTKDRAQLGRLLNSLLSITFLIAAFLIAAASINAYFSAKNPPPWNLAHVYGAGAVALYSGVGRGLIGFWPARPARLWLTIPILCLAVLGSFLVGVNASGVSWFAVVIALGAFIGLIVQDLVTGAPQTLTPVHADKQLSGTSVKVIQMPTPVIILMCLLLIRALFGYKVRPRRAKGR